MSDQETIRPSDSVELSVVIPVYGCADCLITLHQRLRVVLAELDCACEVVFVDDRSRDGSWPIVYKLAASDSQVRAVRLSRNFGQHAAITAGLAECRGKAAVVMDCDLQDPPEVIAEFWQMHTEGFEVVVGSRQARSHAPSRQWLAWGYTKVMQVLGRPKYDPSIGSFSLISRKVINEFLRFRDVNRHYLFIIDWLGFKRTVVPFTQAERFCGQSSYSFMALVRHAVQGILFQTTSFLKWIVAGGAVVAGCGLIATLYIIALYLLHGAQPGWTSLAVSIWTIGGLIMSTLGIVGLYVGQVFDQVKGRPIYVIEDRCDGQLPSTHAQVIRKDSPSPLDSDRVSEFDSSIQTSHPR